MIKHIFQWKKPRNNQSTGYDSGLRPLLFALSEDLDFWNYKTNPDSESGYGQGWYDTKEFLKEYTKGSIKIHYE